MADYKIGDKVNIVGANAVYGGLSSDAGNPIPAWVKQQQHTIMQVSETRREYLLREIYSWVSFDFINLSISVPASRGDATSRTGGRTSRSAVRSTIVTQEEEPEVKLAQKYNSFAVDTIPCYVINLVTQTQTEFGTTPETVSDNVIANFEDQTPKSRPSPFKAYANSGPRDVSFTITLYDDYCPLGLLKTVRRLQALTVPAKTGGYVKAPKCKVRIGDFIDITAVCLSVSVEYEKPYKDNIYSKADVSFSFNEVEDISKYAADWEAIG